MLRNYLIITFRNINRHKGYSFINVFGLAMGMAVFILIILFLGNEISYDKFHENYDRIFRVVSGPPHDKKSYAGTPAPLGPSMLDNFPEVKNIVRIDNRQAVIKYKEKVFNEKQVFFADNSIFEVFSFPLIKGDPLSALKDPDSIVITESIAKKFFGDEDPIGKTLNYNDMLDFRITGLAQDIPENSHLHFDFLIPFKKLENLDDWGAWNYYTYLLLNKSISSKRLKEKFDNWAKQQQKGLFATLNIDHLYYQPLTQIHLQYNRYNIEPAFNGRYIKIFVAIAFIILSLACINFMNLSTARSDKRATEVGIKKALGAQQYTLIKQFLGESIFLALVASLIAIMLLNLILPVFNQFLGKTLSIDYLSPTFILGIFVLIIFTGVFSGSYPAFVISSFNTAEVLKSKIITRSRSLFRNVLVVFQFTISIALIISTMLIFKQMSYIKNMDIGFNQDQIVNIRLNRILYDKSGTIKSEFLKISGVVSASANGYMPSNMNQYQSAWWRGQLESERTGMWVMSVDKDFMDIMQINVIEGRDQIKNFVPVDNREAYVLNESAVRQIGWQSAVGKEFSIYGEERPGIVIGVTKDFHFRSLHHEVAPCAMLVREKSWQISLRIESTDLTTTLKTIKNKWKEFSQGFAFDYYFLDEDIDRLYKSETKLSQLIIAFTTLSIFIACLGLFGLASFLAQRKTREIGIRKVLGASVPRITMGLSEVFLKPVIIANLIAWPISYFAMNRWLQNFAYRTTIRIWPFLMATILAVLITLLTVSYQSIKAATANPVDSLRYE